MTETRCGAIAAIISGIMLIPLQFEVYEIVKTILFNLCVGIPIAAPSNTEAHQERYALDVAGKKSLALTVIPIDRVGDNIDGMTRLHVVRALRPNELRFAEAE